MTTQLILLLPCLFPLLLTFLSCLRHRCRIFSLILSICDFHHQHQLSIFDFQCLPRLVTFHRLLHQSTLGLLLIPANICLYLPHCFGRQSSCKIFLAILLTPLAMIRTAACTRHIGTFNVSKKLSSRRIDKMFTAPPQTPILTAMVGPVQWTTVPLHL